MGDKNPGASADAAREDLEQRRTILQNLKDFDFQIKKNQEDIGNLTEKVESLSKDLDDLVSLYEIVSEQMNPFVGLSKVTKKRLDALENITKEVDTIKSRVGDLESSLEKGSLTLENIKKKEPSSEMIKTPRNETPSTTTAQKTILPSSISTVTSTIPGEVQGYQDLNLDLSEIELDEILSKSLEAFRIEQNIDSMITEFFLTLK
jgi:archaellum component FlaC